jgi:thymidylate synthase (FAD)
MKIIRPRAALEIPVDGAAIINSIEKIGRVCYKSEDRITEGSAGAFIKAIIKRGHESVIEHAGVSIRVICDRGVSHEIVRHRLASYSQESTRYCNYSDNKFDNELTFIKPCFFDEGGEEYSIWLKSMEYSEAAYFKLLERGVEPQFARSALPNSLKTELVMTMNLREWRHFIRLRTAKNSHPQMREISFMILGILKDNIPFIFDEFESI